MLDDEFEMYALFQLVFQINLILTRHLQESEIKFDEDLNLAQIEEASSLDDKSRNISEEVNQSKLTIQRLEQETQSYQEIIAAQSKSEQHVLGHQN